MSTRRSASVGALPREKKHFVSRNESTSGMSLDVRCACQYFQSHSLLPERINPVDSRPNSQLGFHADMQHHEALFQHDQSFINASELGPIIPSKNQLSLHGPLVHQRQEIDRLSMRSLDVGRQQPAVVDLSFVEKYPELEETAKKRGLVVRSISDAMEMDYMLSSCISPGYSDMRDTETLSMRSVTSLRHLPSRSPSRGDLYVAAINITGGRPISTNFSRRTSNADLSHYVAATHITSLPAYQPQHPQFNIIAPTPSIAQANMRSEFSRSTTPQPIASDYRVAKPPISTDYMRPTENKQNLAYLPQPKGETLPQHRAIDMQQYGGANRMHGQLAELSNIPDVVAEFELISSRQASPAPGNVHAVVETATVVNIEDDIKAETLRPPSLGGDIPQESIHLEKQTNIHILSTVSTVNVEQIVQAEIEKAMESRLSRKHMPRHCSPTPKRQLSPGCHYEMGTLELPNTRSSKSSLKRQHTPEPEISMSLTASDQYHLQKITLESKVPQQQTINGEISLQETSPEAKNYASRFKAMFTSAKADAQREASPKRQKSKSPSPRREKSPSPVPNRLKTMFSKNNKNMPVEIKTSGNATMQTTTKPEAEVVSVKVTETFALKVDEMDQYNSRSNQPLPPVPSNASQNVLPLLAASRDDFNKIDRHSAIISEPFAPIILTSSNRGAFLAGNRTLYSSDIDMQSPPSLEESEIRGCSNENSISRTNILKGALISMPINIGSQQQSPRILQPKPAFMDGRTQSQDRARMRASQEDLYATRMIKTVSFHFDERKSRFSDFESLQQKQEQNEFLERTYFSRDHEYEAIEIPSAEEKPSLAKVESTLASNKQNESQEQIAMEVETEGMHQAERVQREFEERFFSSVSTTPRTESRTDYEIHTSQVDSSALEELPLKPENRRKSFMASAQDRTRRMQAGFRAQAGKIKTKLRSPMKKPTTPTGSPIAKERKRFKAPEFSKMKIPEIKRPDMSKLKDFKRPEFTKFNKPDMSKFKIPEKFSTLKLRRSKSFKENEQPSFDSEMESGMRPELAAPPESHQQTKIFDFHFGTYPRAFRKKKKQLVQQSSLGTEEPSIIPSTETQPSLRSSSSPKGDRGPGPVRSRWADKFSDVSYNDSEGSRYRRYGSEVESFDRESSLERRMKDDLEDTGSEVAPDLGILSGADDTRQFAEFDEENRAIHEISSQRAGEFKRRPMVHQDSDLRSEDSKDVGWTDKEVQKNILLRKAELEAEASYLKYPAEEYNRQETQSTASSGKQVVMEQIDDDQFFIRKRGISEDNIEFRQYISHAIREGYDMPLNALQHVGHASEPMECDDYDVPPPKPRRLHKSYRPEDTSQEFNSRSDFGDDLSISQNGSDFYPPKRPLRKVRSKYSMDSQDMPMTDEQLLRGEQYFDDDEDYLRPRCVKLDNNLNDLNKTTLDGSQVLPQAPRRQKRRESSMEKDSYVNGLTNRSVSSSYLQPSEEVIVFRTEHQYPVPLATPEHYTDGSRSASRFGDDDKISRTEADNSSEVHEKYVIDMLENDGYAVVRKEHVPKPTPPARRKKFTRSPGERFATLPNMRTKRSSTSPPERPPPPRDYKPSVVAQEHQPQAPRRKSVPPQNYGQGIEDDYEEPGASMWRAESPRDLQSGDVINKMKYRPLPAPPRPPREKRLRGSSRGSSIQPTEDEEQNFDDHDGGGERIASPSTAKGCEHHDIILQEAEAATQTDPLPDDFVLDEFEITPDMKVIEPRLNSKTLEELLMQEQQRLAEENEEDQQLTRGLQRFRDANQRSFSERSRASSQADRSRSLSRPQTPSSAVIIERRVSTPVFSAKQEQQPETLHAASLIVRPIDDLDLEEQTLRLEGLLTECAQQSKSDAETEQQEGEPEEKALKFALGDYSQVADSSIEALSSGAEESETEIIKADEEEKFQEDKDLDDLDVQALLERIRQEEEEERKQQEYYENELQRLLEAEQPLGEKQRLKEIEEKEGAEIRKLELEQEEARKLQEWVKLEKEKQEKEEDELKKLEEEEAQAFVNKLKEKIERDLQEKEARKLEEKIKQDAQAAEEEEVPQPPPRRKSLANIEAGEIIEVATNTTTTTTAISEEKIVMTELPTHINDLEVERLRVHALQAGQIMVGQLHGGQISSDELECKSGNLIVKNLELPPSFIEDIVERVRSCERGQLLSSETQTSEHASREQLMDETQAQARISEITTGQMEGITNARSLVPPPKPPRQRDLTAIPQQNLDEVTQTDTTTTANATAPMVPVFPTIEYLQSLAPLAFYNLEKQQQQQQSEESHQHHHHRHHCHHYHRCESSGSETEVAATLDNAETTEASPSLRRRHHTRSPTTTDGDNQSLGQASRQFISACSLSLVRAINQLTSSFDDEKKAAVATDATSGITAGNRLCQTPQQLFLFLVVIAVFILVFMLSGRNVHTHHWDYFNPPGNEGRSS